MNFNCYKIEGAYIAKKTKSFQKPYPPRVASSARLAGVKGSEKQREQLAEELNNQLFKLIDDVFEQKIKKNEKPNIQKEELLACINKVAKNINLQLIYEKDPLAEASLENILNKEKKTIVGFRLITKRSVKKGVNEDTLRHEMRHLFDCLTQPKMIARNNTDCLIGRLKNYNEGLDMLHFNFYDNVLYAKKYQNDEEELHMITKKIKAHFGKLNTPSNEKIEILQSWRGGLKSELNAFTDEAQFVCKKNPDKSLKSTVGGYFFESKIKLLEQFLKDELSKVRQLNAEKYGN